MQKMLMNKKNNSSGLSIMYLDFDELCNISFVLRTLTRKIAILLANGVAYRVAPFCCDSGAPKWNR